MSATVRRPGAPNHVAPDYLKHLNKDALRGARIGVVRKSAGFHPGVDVEFERAIAAMKAAGAVIVDADIVTAGQWDDAETQVLLYEFKHDLQAYFAAADAPISRSPT